MKRTPRGEDELQPGQSGKASIPDMDDLMPPLVGRLPEHLGLFFALGPGPFSSGGPKPQGSQRGTSLPAHHQNRQPMPAGHKDRRSAGRVEVAGLDALEAFGPGHGLGRSREPGSQFGEHQTVSARAVAQECEDGVEEGGHEAAVQAAVQVPQERFEKFVAGIL